MVEPVGGLLLAIRENQVGRALLHVVWKDADRRFLGTFELIVLTRLDVAGGAIGITVRGYLANFFHTRVAHVDLTHWILRVKAGCT